MKSNGAATRPSTPWGDAVRAQAVTVLRTAWSQAVRRVRSRDVRAAADRLAAIAGALEEFHTAADPEFLRMSRDLNALLTSATGLAQSVESHAAAVREGLAQSRLAGADGLVARSLAELQDGLNQASAELDRLTEIGVALKGLQRCGHEMQRIARFLHVAASGFAVESARTAGTNEAFADFVTELRELAARVGALGSAITDEAGATIREQVRLAPVIGADLDRLRQLTVHSKRTVRQSSDNIHRLLDSSRSGLQEAEARTREMTRSAGELVYHLQFGDIVRQKLEHVTADLRQAAELAGSGRSSGAERVLRIQQGQLEAVRAESRQTSQRLSAALSRVAAESRGIIATVSGLAGGAPGGADVFQELRSDLLRLDRIREEGRELCRRAGASSNAAIVRASRLACRLHEIEDVNRRIQMQALNAQVKTAWLGVEGLTLGVLSMQVHAAFIDSSELVGNTSSILESIASNSSGALAVESETGDRAGSELQSGLDVIERLRTELQATVVSSCELARQNEERIAEAGRRIEFLSRLDERISVTLSDFAGLTDVLKRASPGEPACDVEEVSERYTMESERDVHRRVAAGCPTSVDRPPAADLGEAVELF